MVNFIEKFIEDMNDVNISLIVNQRAHESKEVYFFQGKGSVLCISKDENKVLYNISYDDLQITITGPSEFAFNVNKDPLFFCQIAM